MSASARLGQLGLALPEVVAPLASYVPAVRTGNLIYTAGQLPMQEGKLLATCKVGADVSPEVGKAMARICVLNALAAVNSLVGIDEVTRVVKVVGYVASSPSFHDQPLVINGASELLGTAFGDAATHARSSIGVAVLPMDAPVEVEVVVQVRS